jgi:hypothetical protein
MCKVAHFGGRLTARTNSKKNAAIEALVAPTDEMRDAGKGGARTLILSIGFMRKAELNERRDDPPCVYWMSACFQAGWILAAQVLNR